MYMYTHIHTHTYIRKEAFWKWKHIAYTLLRIKNKFILRLYSIMYVVLLHYSCFLLFKSCFGNRFLEGVCLKPAKLTVRPSLDC